MNSTINNTISRHVITALTLIMVAIVLASVPVFAANNTDLSQTINSGTLTTDIRDASRNTVASPIVAMSATTFSFDCQSGAARPSGSFGSNAERIYVDNPGAANNGWTLTLAATGGTTDTWANVGSTQLYDFNDASGASAGCTDGADGDSVAGQLSVNPSAGSLTADCATCSTANITLGSSTAYNEGSVDSVTLLNAAAGSDDTGRWYLTGVDMDQTIPAEQANDSYSINLTLTLTSL